MVKINSLQPPFSSSKKGVTRVKTAIIKDCYRRYLRDVELKKIPEMKRPFATIKRKIEEQLFQKKPVVVITPITMSQPQTSRTRKFRIVDDSSSSDESSSSCCNSCTYSTTSKTSNFYSVSTRSSSTDSPIESLKPVTKIYAPPLKLRIKKVNTEFQCVPPYTRPNRMVSESPRNTSYTRCIRKDTELPRNSPLPIQRKVQHDNKPKLNNTKMSEIKKKINMPEPFYESLQIPEVDECDMENFMKLILDDPIEKLDAELRSPAVTGITEKKIQKRKINGLTKSEETIDSPTNTGKQLNIEFKSGSQDTTLLYDGSSTAGIRKGKTEAPSLAVGMLNMPNLSEDDSTQNGEEIDDDLDVLSLFCNSPVNIFGEDEEFEEFEQVLKRVEAKNAMALPVTKSVSEVSLPTKKMDNPKSIVSPVKFEADNIIVACNNMMKSSVKAAATNLSFKSNVSSENDNQGKIVNDIDESNTLFGADYRIIIRIYSPMCIKNLQNNCDASYSCKFTHSMNESTSVKKKILQSEIPAFTVYNITKKLPKAFNKYFDLFIDLLINDNIKDLTMKLDIIIDLVKHCPAPDYYSVILRKLLTNGFTSTAANQILLNNLKLDSSLHRNAVFDICTKSNTEIIPFFDYLIASQYDFDKCPIRNDIINRLSNFIMPYLKVLYRMAKSGNQLPAFLHSLE